jgi:DNA-binding MarR family transcriptional regulator
MTELQQLPPSATLVYKILEQANGELTQQEIVNKSDTHPRTVRWALDRLQEEDLIASRPRPGDARQDLYRLTASRNR